MPTIKGLPIEVADEKAISFIKAPSVSDGDTVDVGLSTIDVAVAQCHNASDVAQVATISAPNVTIQLQAISDASDSGNTPDVTIIAIGER